jgi:hypothetical protein
MQVVILQSHLPRQHAPHATEKRNAGTGKGARVYNFKSRHPSCVFLC